MQTLYSRASPIVQPMLMLWAYDIYKSQLSTGTIMLINQHHNNRPDDLDNMCGAVRTCEGIFNFTIYLIFFFLEHDFVTCISLSFFFNDGTEGGEALAENLFKNKREPSAS